MPATVDHIEPEEWRDIPDWEGLYRVSSHGNIRRVCQPVGSRYKSCQNRKFSTTPKGYKTIVLRDGHKRYGSFQVHVLVCLVFNGVKPSVKHQVAYNDGDLAHNYYKNLRWATPKENQADSITHGTKPVGENTGFNKIKEADVLIIRELNSLGFVQKDMAKLWGLHQSQISRICSGLRWRHTEAMVA